MPYSNSTPTPLSLNLTHPSLRNNFDFDHSSFYVGFQGAHKNIANIQLIKPVFILKYVISGEGSLTINNVTHKIKADDIFLLPKNVLLSYAAKEDNPFSYYYFGMDGVRIEQFFQLLGLTPEKPVKNYNDPEIKTLFIKLFELLKAHSVSSNLEAFSLLYRLFYLMSKSEKQNSTAQKNPDFTYINHAILYIKNNYNSDISIAELADQLGINRSYFSDLFKKQTKYSPQDYLLRYRIAQSCKLLTMEESVTAAGSKCGFNTPSNFSVQFKKVMGLTPNEFRIRAQSDNAPPLSFEKLYDDL